MPRFNPVSFDTLADGTSYHAENKKSFHKIAKQQLKLLAEALKLKPTSYDLSTNEGGIAVSGEITLHTDFAYIQVSSSAIRRGATVMYRAVKNRKDYCGMRNHFAGSIELADPERLADMVIAACQQDGRLPRSDGTVPGFDPLAYA